MKKLIGIALSFGMIGLLTGCAGISSTNRVIIGVVADVDTNPVAGAGVTTTPPTWSVSTDKSGRYIIKGVKEGVYTLRASKLGYAPTEVKITVHGPEFVQGDIQLIPQEMIPVPAPVYVEPAPAAAVPAPSAGQAASEAPAAVEKSGKAWWENK